MRWERKVLLKWGLLYFLVLYTFRLPGLRKWIFVILGAGFFIGTILRIINKYPGKKEPLFLDTWATGWSILGYLLSPRFVFSTFSLFILLILLPHLLYLLHSQKTLSHISDKQDREKTPPCSKI